MNDFDFTKELKHAFGATIGAGSQVTEREGKKDGDKSVTVVGAEKDVLHRFYTAFPRNSLTKAELRGEKTEFDFRLYPSGMWVKLKINHPKSSGDETRIYFRQGVFYPSPGDFWFIFSRNGEPWIGCLRAKELEAVRGGKQLDPQNGLDSACEDDYQTILNAGPKAKIMTVTSAYPRDPNVASSALKASGYKCELMPRAPTFPSKVTGNPYLEAHHLLPIFEQRNFPDHNLDVVENICILNPFAHKMLHHAPKSDIIAPLTDLYNARKRFFSSLGVSLDRVLESYT